MNSGGSALITGTILIGIGCILLYLVPTLINIQGLEPQEKISFAHSNHFASVTTKLNFITNSYPQQISIYYHVLPDGKNGFLAFALPYNGTLVLHDKIWYLQQVTPDYVLLYRNITCSTSSCAAEEDEFRFMINGTIDSLRLPNHYLQLPFQNNPSDNKVSEVIYSISNGTSYKLGWDLTRTTIQLTLDKKFDEIITQPEATLSLIPNPNGGNNNVLNWNLENVNTVFTAKYSDNDFREFVNFRQTWIGISIGSGVSMIIAGVALIRNERGTESLKRFVKVQRHVQDANTAYTLKEYQSAKNSYDLAIKDDPDNLDTILLAGNSFYQMKRYSDAIPYYEKILEKNPNHVGALNNIGACYDGLGKLENNFEYYEKAFEYYERTLDINPNHLDAINNMGALLLDLNESDIALPFFNEVIAAERETPQILTNKGKALTSLKEFENALVCFNKALEIDPKFTDALLSKATAFYNEQDYKNAVICYKRILKIEPSKYECLYNLSLCYLRLEENDKAIKFAREYLAIKSLHVDTLITLGIALAKKGDHKEAIKNYNLILDKDENHKDALYNKALSLMLSNLPDLALPLLDKIIMQQPEDLGTLLTKGNCYLVLGRIPEAIELFNKVLFIEPTNSEAINLKKQAENKQQS